MNTYSGEYMNTLRRFIFWSVISSCLALVVYPVCVNVVNRGGIHNEVPHVTHKTEVLPSRSSHQYLYRLGYQYSSQCDCVTPVRPTIQLVSDVADKSNLYGDKHRP
jgi:hypothetical protein